MADPKVVLITGASSGIGKACASHLASLGHTVYGTSRKGGDATGSIRMIPMDVTDDRSVVDGVERVVREAGRLDALVNNAGYGIAGAVEETSIQEAQQQFDTNFFGMFRLTKAVLPRMRERRSGHIVNMGSIGGLISIPFQSFYCASKFAIEGFTEALRMEVRGFGIRVALLEPGDHQTNFTRSRVRTQESRKEGSPYRDAFDKALGVMERDEQNGPSPEGIARCIAAIVSDASPALRHPVGMFLQRFAITLKSALPGGVFESIIRSTYKL
jgi:NAD(P)-dependent dehydrogenase (short-subunit alcohol dehydrogenase family)